MYQKRNNSLVVKSLILIKLITLTLMTACNPPKHKVDLIVFNAKIYTVDVEFSIAEAFAVANGKFVAIGSEDEILSVYESTEKLDAGGKVIYPGFIDGHCHFFGYGENLIRYADLAGSTSFDEIISRLKEHAAAHPSEWLLGRGWDQNRWTDNRVKHKQEQRIFKILFKHRSAGFLKVVNLADDFNEFVCDKSSLLGFCTVVLQHVKRHGMLNVGWIEIHHILHARFRNKCQDIFRVVAVRVNKRNAIVVFNVLLHQIFQKCAFACSGLPDNVHMSETVFC